MRIIIVGCGRLGSELANSLWLDRHDIAVIDQDPEAFLRLAKTFTGNRIVGHAMDQDTLKQARIEDVDAFVAVTGDDNLNIISARIAREVYYVPRVVTRIYDPIRANIYERLGVPTVSTTTWAVNKIEDLIFHRALDVQLSFGNGEVELVRVAIPVGLFGRTVADITIPGELEVVVITRRGRSFIPTLGTVFEEGDVARVMVSRSAIGRLEEFISAVA
ncbi:MAG: TrkA family potassium uptake protein [Firmicutes bacterium]|nr:TrkA family potassium uptake protein [Bacillota bacterium]